MKAKLLLLKIFLVFFAFISAFVVTHHTTPIVYADYCDTANGDFADSSQGSYGANAVYNYCYDSFLGIWDRGNCTDCENPNTSNHTTSTLVGPDGNTYQADRYCSGGNCQWSTTCVTCAASGIPAPTDDPTIIYDPPPPPPPNLPACQIVRATKIANFNWQCCGGANGNACRNNIIARGDACPIGVLGAFCNTPNYDITTTGSLSCDAGQKDFLTTSPAYEFNYTGDQTISSLVLMGSSGNQSPGWFSDDALDMTVQKPDGSITDRINILSRPNCLSSSFNISPDTNLVNKFPATFNQVGTYRVWLTMYDQCGYAYGNSDIYFGQCGKTYTVKGSVFTDTNGNKKKDAGEPIYNGSISITTDKGSQVNVVVNNGSYTISNLIYGDVIKVFYNPPLPLGYQLVYPLGSPPQFQVTVGDSICSTDSTTGASCDAGGNIDSLNFALTNSTPWIQSKGLDMRMDNGIKTTIPAGSVCGTQASVLNLPSAATAGVAFTGDTNADLGSGSTPWLVGGSGANAEVYTPNKTALSTSYATILALVNKSGLTRIPLDDGTNPNCVVGTPTNCTLPSITTSGVYVSNGNVAFNALSIGNAGKINVIFLVNGNLTFWGNVTLNNGSTAFFTAKNVIVASTVGSAVPTCSTANSELQGFFSADNIFNVIGNNGNCTVPDKMLHISGTVIVNAALGDGIFKNGRDLCGNNNYPSVIFSGNPNLLLNAPDILRHKGRTYQEVAP